ncbi:MAG: thiamine biosynthesis protein [Verrucomicrobiales bacterium]|nr:thiamine biosynthesis protein [Verrucomicrobiales bacterium]
MKNTLIHQFTSTFVAVLVLAVTGCNQRSVPPTNTEANTVKKVSLRLPWLFNVEAAGIFVAKEKGYYRDAGLDLTVNAGGIGLDPVQLVNGGSDDIGICDGAAVIIGRSKGLPVRAVAAEYQKSPLCYVTLKKSGISTVKDFKGKRIGTQPFQLYLLQTMLAANGMTLNDVQNVPVQFDIRPLIEGQVDAFASFVSDEPIQLALKNIESQTVMAAENGYPFYANVIFSTDKTIKEHPEIIRAFIAATFKGWKDVVADPDAAAKLVVEKYNKELTYEQQKRSVKVISDLLTANLGQNAMGHMTIDRWKQSIETLTKYEQISSPVKAEDLVSMEFQNAVSAK